MEIEKIKHLNWFISNGKYKNRQNCVWCGISNGRTFQNSLGFWILIVFQIEKKSKNLLIFEFGKFEKFPIWKLIKYSKLFNLKN